jgi:hypothetical protein
MRFGIGLSRRLRQVLQVRELLAYNSMQACMTMILANV